MKKIILSLMVCILLFTLTGCTEESGYPTATKEFYVNDFADLISPEDEQKILSNAVTLADKTTAQVVVVTINDLNGEEPWEYALNLGRSWGVGDKEKDNGVVILLSENDREIYISVGYGLEGALPDSKTGRIIDLYGKEYLKANEFSKGLLEIQNAIVGEVYIEYGLEAQNGYTSINNIQYIAEEDTGSVFVSWIIMVVIILILSFIFKGRGPILFFPGMSFRTHHGGFGGGFGSSGGFGGFKGGGGSFGGGGAGRKF